MGLIASAARTSPRPAQPVDAQDIATLQTRLLALADELNASAANCAHARAIREMHGDRMKRALACAMRQLLLDDTSAAKAEGLSRSSEAYGKELEALAADLKTAEEYIQAHDATRAKFEAVRSCLSSAKHAAESY